MADAVLIPGDLFDNRAPKPDVLAEAINLFRDLSRRKWGARMAEIHTSHSTYTEIPIIAIPGTHERRAQGAENPVNLLSLAGLLVDVSDGYATIAKGGEKVTIYGIGGVSDERFLDTIKALDPKPVEGTFNIFMFHQSLYELLPFSKDFAHIDDLPKGFDLYVNGHIHNKVEKKAHGKPFIIPGSTVLTQLKDAEQEGKGFFLFDTVARTYTFIDLPTRKFVAEKVDATGKEPTELAEEIDRSIKRLAVGKDRPVIRIEIVGSLKKGFKATDINLQEIVNRYRSKAIVEIAKAGIDTNSDAGAEAIRKGKIGEMSVKDYGLGIFLEKLRENKYRLDIAPSYLFDVLSSDLSKDKAIKKALYELLKQE